VWGWGLQAAVVALVLVLLVVAAFSPALSNDFVWDDDANFLENVSYRGLGWSQIHWAWTSFQLGVYQPLAWMLLELQYVLFGLRTWGYHLTSLVLYAIDTVVLYLLIMALLVRCRPALQRASPTDLALGAGLAVAPFAVHPLRTEVVAWASCQPYLLCSLCSMLSVLAYLRAFRDGAAPRRNWLAGAFLLFVAALLSKAVAVSLPAVFLILDVYPLGRLGRGPGRWFGPSVRTVWWEKVPFVGLSVVFMGLAVAGRIQVHHLVTYEAWGLMARLVQACYGIWFYLVKTVLPTDITAYYRIPEQAVVRSPLFLSSVLGTLLATASAFLLRRRWPGLLAVWLSYLVILAPNLGLLRVGDQIAADRYSYISMMGGVVLLAGGLCRVLQARQHVWAVATRLPIAGLAVMLLGLVMLSRAQCRTWRTPETVWRHVLNHGGNHSFVAHNNLGLILFRQRRIEEAGTHFALALRLNPGYPEALNNRGLLLQDEGRTDEAKADFEAAVRLDPDFPDAHCNLGWLLFKQGRSSEARAQLDEALRINPEHAAARVSLGSMLSKQGRVEEAMAQFNDVLRLNPDNAVAHNDRAMILAACADAKYRDGQRAVEVATRACSLTEWKDPSMVDTLAAAHAEAGDFDSAVKWQTRAIDLLTDENQKADFRSRLRLYQARKPYREPTVAQSSPR
jgi:Flp pilus assembly protein TadD